MNKTIGIVVFTLLSAGLVSLSMAASFTSGATAPGFLTVELTNFKQPTGETKLNISQVMYSGAVIAQPQVANGLVDNNNGQGLSEAEHAAGHYQFTGNNGGTVSFLVSDANNPKNTCTVTVSSSQSTSSTTINFSPSNTTLCTSLAAHKTISLVAGTTINVALTYQ